MTRDSKKPTLSPDAYRQRDRAILQQVGTYGVGITESVNAAIGGGKNLGHIVRRLADSAELTLLSRALGGVSCFQLTEASCERFGVPTERSRPFGSQAMDKSLAVLVWCMLSSHRRYKIERTTLQEIFPGVKFPTNQVHCVSEEDNRRVAWRVMLVQGNHEPALKALKQELASLPSELQNAIEAHQYGFVLLVDSVVKQGVIEAAAQRSGLRDFALVRVDLSATANTLADYLRKRAKNK